MIGAEFDLLRILLDYAPAAIAVFDRNMTYIAASRRYIADYRLTDTEIVGRSHYDVFPEIPEQWKAIHRRCLAGAVERAEEEPFLRADGRLDWVRWEIHPWHEQSGAIGGIILFSEVITARKLAAEALLESEKRFRVALASAPLTVFNQDQDLRYTWISNPTLGETAESVIGRTDDEILGPESAAQLSALKRRALGAGKSTQEEVLVRNHGASAYYDLFIEPVHNEDHEVIGITGAAYDVTELKRTQQQLLELNHTLEERIRQRTAEVQDLYDNSPTGYHSLDVDGNVVRINQTELDWLGYTRDDVIGRPIAAFLTPASCTIFQAHFPGYKARGWLRDLELELIRKDGSILPVIVSATAIYDETGNYVMSRSTVFDNTERKEAEYALRHANVEIEQAMRLKDEFLANMSHELRTPLNGILTASEILAEQIYGPLNERQMRSLRHVETCGRHLLAIIDDLLDISKIEAGKLELELQPVAIDEICRASLLLVSESAQKKQIQLSYNNRLPYATIQADPLRLKQILVNLLDNAVKFTPEGGDVQLIVDSSGGEEMIDLAVQDSGPGIASANLSKLFQPFSQLDAGLARQFEGAGLGLALVKRLVVQHGGTVYVESAGVAGQGSRFTVSLPRPCVEVHQ
jgi:PAS domain S-box-containing protein